MVAHTHAAFQEVADKITTGTELVSGIASSSEQQALGVRSVEQAIERIEALTRRNVANAEEAAQGASAITRQVENTHGYLAELEAAIEGSRAGKVRD